jgi:hypothetical protein
MGVGHDILFFKNMDLGRPGTACGKPERDAPLWIMCPFANPLKNPNRSPKACYFEKFGRKFGRMRLSGI